MKEELKNMINPTETIMYEGCPDKKTFILESIFNPMLPVALIWGFFDMMMLFMSSTSDSVRVNGNQVSTQQGLMFIVPFLLIHMLPVWDIFRWCFHMLH